ncbi:LysE family translocator [Oceanospirillum sanctuarii]|uniref:LysE family translocator n=1 Tax=Oceanospirillum sanctuarii TaxID=1434821 RepID=UPI000A3B1593|nr:LysE family translocator [Oceanospirillum sanctuarii]
MLSLTELTVYILTLGAAYLLPGPDMALIMASASGRGFRQAVMTSAGLSAARGLHVLLAALGLAAVLAAHPDLLNVIQWIGAAYLVFLAWKILSAGSLTAGEINSEHQRSLAAIRRGFLTNLLNPKALMFCSLLLPQFIDLQPDSSNHVPVLAQYLYLGIVLVITGIIFDLMIAASVCAVAARVKITQTGQKIQKWLFSGVFIAGAIRLSLSEL